MQPILSTHCLPASYNKAQVFFESVVNPIPRSAFAIGSGCELCCCLENRLKMCSLWHNVFCLIPLFLNSKLSLLSHLMGRNIFPPSRSHEKKNTFFPTGLAVRPVDVERFFWLDAEVVFGRLSCSSLVLGAAALGTVPLYLPTS